MLEKPRIRTLMDSQHVKGFETLHKFASQYFLSYFLVTLKENHLGKLCFSSISNLETIS